MHFQNLEKISHINILSHTAVLDFSNKTGISYTLKVLFLKMYIVVCTQVFKWEPIS